MRAVSVETKVLGGFGAALAIFLILGGVAYENARRSLQDTRLAAQSHEVIGTLDALLSQLYQAEAAQRGYVVAGTASYLDLRREAISSLDPLLARLDKMIPGDATHAARVQEVRALISRRVEIFEQYRVWRETSGLQETARRFGAGPPVMARLRATVEEMKQQERRRILDRESAGARRARHAYIVFGVLGLALLGVLLICFYRIRADLRARGDAKAQLRAKDEEIHAMLESAPDAMVMVDGDGRIVQINAQAEKLFGHAREALLRQTVEMLIPERFRVQHQKYRAQFATSPHTRPLGGIDAVLAGLRKDGSEFAAEIALHPLRSNNQLLFTATVRDVSERRHLEELLTHHMAREQTLGKTLSLLSSSANRDELLHQMLALLEQHFASPACAVYLFDQWTGQLRRESQRGTMPGLAQEYALEGNVVADTMRHNRVQRIAGRELAAIIGADSVPLAEIVAAPIQHFTRRHGVLVLAMVRPATDADSVFLERLCSLLSVALNNLRLAGDLQLLAQQLRVRGEELAHGNLLLEEATRLKSEFLANMSHELRTPLNAIIGFAELFREGMLGPLSTEQAEHIGDIFTSGQQLLALIDDILDLSRIEAGRMEIGFEPVDLQALLQASIAVVKEKAMQHRLALELEIGAGPRNVLLDPRRTKQILYNLLSNAVKFTPDGGSITVRANQVRAPGGVAPPTLAPGDYLEFAVSDSGIGINSKDQTRLFQPFMRIETPMSHKQSGIGLGLAMVKQLTALHGGGVSVESEPDRGSTFRVWLPFHGADDAAAPTLVRVRRSAGDRPPRALLIEDDDSAAAIERLHLERAGFETMRAASADAGLAAISEYRPDVIILDILLPGTDGWTLLQRVKSKPVFAHIPVVIVSVLADASRGFTLGAANVLHKPVARDQLIGALKALGLLPHNADDRRNIRILVADDDPKAVELVATHLEAAQYRVSRAYSGREAIDTVRRTLPDLLILDLIMPPPSGFDIVRELKGDPRTAGIPILVLTAKTLTAEDRRLLDGQVMRIVEKAEFNPSEFLNEVHRALSRWTAASGTAPI